MTTTAHPEPVTDGHDVLAVLGSMRTIRSYAPDPVPPELVDKLVWAGTRAGSPYNSQCWDFVVVRDPAQRQRLADALAGFRPGESTEEPEAARRVAAVEKLVAGLADVPVLIFVVGTLVWPVDRPEPKYTFSAAYTAAQNILVAARSLGLGAGFTMLHQPAEAAFRAILGIPDDKLLCVTIPVGWPAAGVGPVRRRPIAEVIHDDRW